MKRTQVTLAWAAAALVTFQVAAPAAQTTEADRIDGLHGQRPLDGTECLRFITPQVLELARTGTKGRGQEPASWNFVPGGTFTPPNPTSYAVTVNGQPAAVTFGGFRRRVAHAPLAQFDVAIDNRVYLQLATPAQPGDVVSITTDGWGTGTPDTRSATLTSARRNPAIHVNQVGYPANGPKQGMAGYYLGSGGELDIPAAAFRIVDTASGATAFTGVLAPRPDTGFDTVPLPYQKVMVAEFSALTSAGTYQLEIDGLGRSLEFRIDPDMALNFARMYAQGLYNQRCGVALTLPYSRHTHAACHVAAASIPTGDAQFQDTWATIAADNSDSAGTRITSVETQLYPILRSGPIDVSGGHHDAGDYSKYTINSAQLIHHLAFAADNFPGAGDLDNLGIPESGDGKRDLLQEAKQEADYLVKLQDDDGGFFFLVYPLHRSYENNVLPDAGDPQVVWPKNTAATAAAVGALADIASSPRFKQQFPVEAALYLQKATAGWTFLLNAIQAHGKAGSYQTLTHYGDLFAHDDELAWAAAAMFVATGDPACQQKFIEWYNPQDPATVRWGWWYLFEGYGCAARSYSFAVSSGKRTLAEMDPLQFAKTQAIVKTAGDAIASRSLQSAYGTCLDDASKRFMTAGWFFSGERAFDITARNALEARADWQTLVLGNTNFELGCNPLNVSFVTGAGQHQQHEIVSQYAQNDNRELPPSGLPLGNLQAGFPWTNLYQSELNQMNFPFDWVTSNQYPLYDRWGDTFNTATECVVAQQARELGSMCALAANAPGAATPWQTASAEIVSIAQFLPQDQVATFTLQAGTLDLSNAQVIWETPEECYIGGPSFQTTPSKTGTFWVEAEAVLPDGKRVSARTEVGIQAAQGGSEFPLQANTVALYHFNGDFNDASPNGFNLTQHGRVDFDPLATGWMANPAGSALRFHGIGDFLTVQLPDTRISPGSTPSPLTVEAWIRPLAYKTYGVSNDPLLNLYQAWDSQFGAQQDMWVQPNNPAITADGIPLLGRTQWQQLIQIGTWQLLAISRDASGQYTVALNGQTVGTATAPTTTRYDNTSDWTLTFGNFDGYIDELRITGSIPGTTPTGNTGSPTTTTPPAPAVIPLATTIQPFASEFAVDAATVALYHFNGDFLDASGNHFDLAPIGNVTFVPTTHADGTPAGQAARFRNFGDSLSALIPDAWIAPGTTPQGLTLEAWIFPRAYKAYGHDVGRILWLEQSWDSSLGILQDIWLTPAAPMLRSAQTTVFANSQWASAITPGQWQKLTVAQDIYGNVSLKVNDLLVASALVPNSYGRTDDWLFSLGDIDADVDEVRISRSGPVPTTGTGTAGTGTPGAGSGTTPGPTSPPATAGIASIQPFDREFEADANTVALYHFNGDFLDDSGNEFDLTPAGNVTFVPVTHADGSPAGQAAHFSNFGDSLATLIPDAWIAPGDTSQELTLEAWIYPRGYKAWGHDCGRILWLEQWWDSSLGIYQDKWLTPASPMLLSAQTKVFTNSQWDSAVTLDQWQKLTVTRDTAGTVTLKVNDVKVASGLVSNLYGRTNDWTFRIGDIDADIDEVRISRTINPSPAPEGFANDAHTIALYHFDGDFQDSSGNNHHLTAAGTTSLLANPTWMNHPYGGCAAFANLGDKLTVTIPNSEIAPATSDLCIEARIFPTAFLAWGHDSYNILRLFQYWDSSLGFLQDKWASPGTPVLLAGNTTVFSNSGWSSNIATGMWHTLKITRTTGNVVSLAVDGNVLVSSTVLVQTGRDDDWLLELGNFTGAIDELRISRVAR